MAMSDITTGGPANLQAKPKTLSASAALAALFATLLIGSEFVAVAGATTWAVASSLELGGPVLTALEGAAIAGSLVFTALFARRAYQAERRFRTKPDAL